MESRSSSFRRSRYTGPAAAAGCCSAPSRVTRRSAPSIITATYDANVTHTRHPHGTGARAAALPARAATPNGRRPPPPRPEHFLFAFFLKKNASRLVHFLSIQ